MLKKTIILLISIACHISPSYGMLAQLFSKPEEKTPTVSVGVHKSTVDVLEKLTDKAHTIALSLQPAAQTIALSLQPAAHTATQGAQATVETLNECFQEAAVRCTGAGVVIAAVAGGACHAWSCPTVVAVGAGAACLMTPRTYLDFVKSRVELNRPRPVPAPLSMSNNALVSEEKKNQ
jgi:hypothetical protein